MPFLNFNGNIHTDDEPLYSAGNRALRYGEGLIETMLWQNGNIRLWEYHIRRLQQSLSLLGFPAFPGNLFREEINKIITVREHMETSMIRTQFSLNEQQELQYMIECLALPDSAQEPGKGLIVGISQKIVKNADAVSALKTTSRLSYSLAAREAQQEGWEDALLLNANGRIAESTISNIFSIRNREIFTPPLNEGCIAGVMRSYLLEMGTFAGMPVNERSFSPEELLDSDEIFLTNAIRGVQPVASLQGKEYGIILGRQLMDEISGRNL